MHFVNAMCVWLCIKSTFIESPFRNSSAFADRYVDRFTRSTGNISLICSSHVSFFPSTLSILRSNDGKYVRSLNSAKLTSVNTPAWNLTTEPLWIPEHLRHSSIFRDTNLIARALPRPPFLNCFPHRNLCHPRLPSSNVPSPPKFLPQRVMV